MARNAMRLLGLAIGALGFLASAISVAVPDLRLSLERSVMTPAGLYAIAALRIAIGLVLALMWLIGGRFNRRRREAVLD